MWNGDGNHAVLTKDGVAFIHLAAAVSLFVDPPTILVRPQSQQVKAGGIASFFCTAQGAPPPQIHWRKNGKRISRTLQITNSISSDQAKYECVANNSVGTEYSKSTLLYVKVRRVAPSFSIPPPTLSEVTLGASLNLNCVAVGAPMPVVQWRKYPATDIMPDDNLPVGKNVLYLTDIQESANYTCTASSPIGVIHATSMVKVQSLPGPPENIQVSDITATSVKLSWSYKGPDELQYYVIQHKPKQANQPFTEISGITTMYYHVRGLSPYTEYELYVIAVNHIGRGPPSAPVTVTTGETSQ
ncbi:hypothetical protein HZH68_010968 [Vespula germanica]|uniref:protein-tyrosine-phosphatase n=1 Tax=Vespula germanica TaxID=30212 RepID=A0A834MZR8_VESGE|nr:hypothetical protein HZH68_010968 [Vespula germanica]